MDSILRIQVRVLARQAVQQLQQLGKQLGILGAASGVAGSGIGGTGGAANRANSAVGAWAARLVKTGKDLQWVGRQINFNFTIPLLYAAGAATKWALDTERAFVRLQKVYGDGGAVAAGTFDMIAKGVRMLSDEYGVAQEQVMQLAADWAAAGAEGGDLLQAVKTSIDVSILGDYEDLGAVFEDLIAIQGAYKFSAEELAVAIAQLNTVENEAAISPQGLVQGMSRAGAAAELAGLSFQETAALLTVLAPAFGSATTAGNGLKSMLTRLMAPSGEVRDILGDLGDNFLDAFFREDGVGRLKMIAGAFDTLNDSQRAWLVGEVAGAYQANRFAAIMRDLNLDFGVYEETLSKIQAQEQATAEATRAAQEALDEKNVTRATNEIQKLLESDPRKLEIAFTRMKNSMIQAIMPLVPWFVKLAEGIAQLFQWFAELPKGAQAAIVLFLGLTVATGILAQAIGSIRIVVGTFVQGILFMIGVLQGLMGAQVAAAGVTTATEGIKQRSVLTSTAIQIGAWIRLRAAAIGSAVASAAAWVAASGPIVAAVVAAAIAIAAVTAYVIANWEEVTAALSTFGGMVADAAGRIVQTLANAFAALPRIVSSAFTAVINIIRRAIEIIIELLSYLNPFARHSPSLVDNVKAGVAVIAAEYAKLGNIGITFRQATSDLERFTKATEALRRASQNRERGEQRKEIVQGAPSAGPLVDQLYADLDQLNAILASVARAIVAQTAIVDAAKAAYDRAAAAVDKYGEAVQAQRDKVQDLAEQIDEANDIINDLANTPIEGMGAMEDAIFANEMAQKKLRLEILRLEQAHGSYEEIKNQIAEIEGSLESLRATMADLRQAGAGQDILSVYQDQVDALEGQQDTLVTQADVIAALREQLEELQTAGEILDLERALKFDALVRQIEDLVDTTEEMTFEEIIAGIKAQQKVVDKLTKSYDKEKKTLDAMEKKLKDMEKARDSLRDIYDKENAKLQQMEETYRQTERAINDIESALRDAAAAWRELNDEAAGGGGGGGVGGGGMPGGGNFDDVMGDVEDMLNNMDLETLLEEWEKQFDDLDPFKGLREAWDNLKSKFTGAIEFIKTWALSFMLGLGILPSLLWRWRGTIGDIVGGVVDFFKKLPGRAKDALALGWEWLKEKGSALIALLATGISNGWEFVKAWFKDLPNKVVAAISFIGGAAGNLGLKGLNMIAAIGDGAREKWESIKSWFADLPNKISGAISFITGKAGAFGLKGLNIIAAIGDGAKAKWETVKAWFKDLPNKIKGAISFIVGAAGAFGLKGLQIIAAIGDGAKDKWETVKTWFGNMPSRIISTLGSLGEKALEWGKKLLGELALGIIDAAESMPGSGAFSWLLDQILPGETELHELRDDVEEWVYGDVTGGVEDASEAARVYFEGGGGGGGMLVQAWSGNLADAFKADSTKRRIAAGLAVIRTVADATLTTKTFASHAKNLADGLKSSLETNMKGAPKTYAGTIGANLKTWAGDQKQTLVPRGLEVAAGLLSGFKLGEALNKLYLAGAPGRITAAVPDTSKSLTARGTSAMSGLYSGLTSGWSSKYGPSVWLGGIPNRVAGAAGSTSTSLYSRGVSATVGMTSGLSAGWYSKYGPSVYLSGIGGKAAGAVGSLSLTLYNAGLALMNGLYSGIYNGWLAVRLLLTTISLAIPSWKGPPEKDRKMLVENGQLVMQGFQEGLSSGWKDTQRLLGGMTTSLAGHSPNVVLSPSQGNEGGRTINFYGDISLPGIADPKDAGRFLNNLEALAAN